MTRRLVCSSFFYMGKCLSWWLNAGIWFVCYKVIVSTNSSQEMNFDREITVKSIPNIWTIFWIFFKTSRGSISKVDLSWNFFCLQIQLRKQNSMIFILIWLEPRNAKRISILAFNCIMLSIHTLIDHTWNHHPLSA